MHRGSQKKPVCVLLVCSCNKFNVWSVCSYTVKDLLALPFFSEVEAIDIKAIPSSNDDEVRLVFLVPIKGPKGQNQSQQQQTHETYERLFNLHSDQAQHIAQDMVKSVMNFLCNKYNFVLGEVECNT